METQPTAQRAPWTGKEGILAASDTPPAGQVFLSRVLASPGVPFIHGLRFAGLPIGGTLARRSYPLLPRPISVRRAALLPK